MSFDEFVERRGTGCVKWDEAPADDIIPLWVADMDFPAAPAIREAVSRRAAHGVFGYAVVEEPYYEAVISWFRRRHNWNISREEILYTTGGVPAMSVVIKALTMPGEKVLILSPDYNCFFSSIRNNGCEVLETPLGSVECRTESVEFATAQPSANSSAVANSKLYTLNSTLKHTVDWSDFEAKCADEKTTVFLLCNPHNPTGRVWTREELERMNDICLRHGVKVVSDEIHCELIMPEHTFQPFAAVSEACRMNSVIINSPSKPFNIAGLQMANIVCSQPEWRRRIDRAININEVCDLNPFAPVALIAAYNESERWLDDLNAYLWGNFCAMRDYLAEVLPEVRVTNLEGTYLSWIDVSAILKATVGDVPSPTEAFCDRLLREARVWVNPGTMYGPKTGEGYIRVNIACPRSLLMEGVRRICTLEIK